MVKIIYIHSLLIMFGIGALLAQTNPTDIVHLSTVTQNLKAPVRFAIDASDNIYVTEDYGVSIKKYDNNGNFIDSIYQQGIFPMAIAVNNSGQIFTSDRHSGKIFRVGSNGNFTLFSSYCVFPTSMTFSPDQKLFVTDGKQKSLFVFDISGNLIQTIGAGTFTFPSEVVYDSRNSRILVAEQGGYGPGVGMSGYPLCKIWVFALNGTSMGSFSSAGNSNGKFYRIQGMTIGKCGNLYVCDPYQGNISVFNENNVFITRFSSFGEQPGQMNVPMDILFDSNDRIIVASMNNGKLEIYNVNDSLPTSRIIHSDTTICSGQSANIEIRFTGTAPWTFTYTIDGLNPTSVTTSNNPYLLNTTQAGLYEISALTDQFKTGTCFSGSARINVNSALPTTTISSGNIILCQGSSVNIPNQFTGNSPWNFTYTRDGQNPVSVQTANNPYNISATEAGLYEVTAVSSGGCVGNVFIGNANVISTILPTANFTDHSASVCQGELAQLPVHFTGNSPWTLSYSINETSNYTYITEENPFIIQASEAGNYKIVSVTSNGCIGYSTDLLASVELKPLPTLTMTPVNATICQGSTVDFPITFTGQPPFIFTYSVNNTFFNTITTYYSQYLLTSQDTGEYQFLTIEGNGCTGDVLPSSSYINSYTLPTAQFTFGNSQVSVCQGQFASLPVSFTGTPPWTITYAVNNVVMDTITTYDNPYSMNVAGGGFYEIKSVTDAYCYNWTAIGNPEVVITPLPESIMTASSVTSCSGLLADIPINFNGIAPWTFVYTIDGANPTTITTYQNPYLLAVNTPGHYEVVGISSGSCNGTSMFGNTDLISAENPVPAFTYNSNGFEFTFTNNSLYSDSYIWNFGDGLSSSNINPVHLFVSPTLYDVSLTASNSLCPDSTITQTIDLTMLMVNTSISDNEISVYPNPSIGPITIALPQSVISDWKVEVINAVGQVVYFGNLNKSKEYIDLTKVAPGLYSVNVISSEMSKTVKLIIK